MRSSRGYTSSFQTLSADLRLDEISLVSENWTFALAAFRATLVFPVLSCSRISSCFEIFIPSVQSKTSMTLFVLESGYNLQSYLYVLGTLFGSYGNAFWLGLLPITLSPSPSSSGIYWHFLLLFGWTSMCDILHRWLFPRRIGNFYIFEMTTKMRKKAWKSKSQKTHIISFLSVDLEF